MLLSAILTLLFDLINELAADLFSSQSSMLTASLSDGIPALYRYAAIAQQVVLPIGYTVLSLFFLLALFDCSRKAESAGGGTTMGVEMIVGVLIKLVLCKILMDNADVLMTGIFDAVNYITVQISGIVPTETASVTLELSLLESLALSIFGGLPYLLLGLVALLLMGLVWVRSRIMIWTRFLEAYMYLIISPVPIATLAGEEWSQVGKNFLKSFAAVAIQGTMLFLVLSFFPVLVNALSAAVSGLGGLLGALAMECLYSLLLLSALSGTSRMAEKICGAM